MQVRIRNLDTGAVFAFQFPQVVPRTSYSSVSGRAGIRGGGVVIDYSHDDRLTWVMRGTLIRESWRDIVETDFEELLPLWRGSGGAKPRCRLEGIGERSYTGVVDEIRTVEFGTPDPQGNFSGASFEVVFITDPTPQASPTGLRRIGAA